MLVFPPFLGGVILQQGLVTRIFIPLSAFCLASSAAYIFNDIKDSANDANHPAKRNRPIPAGLVSKSEATIFLLVLLGTAVYFAFLVSFLFVVLLSAYLVISAAYSAKLKELPLVDIFSIAAGFLLRLQAGGEAFGVVISEWLFLSVFLLSLFLSSGKRLCEQNSMGKSAALHRKSLQCYPNGFLEGTLYFTAATALVTYAMYVISRHALVYTVPLCTFGLLRYIYRVKTGLGGDPTESLIKDVPLLVTALIWVVVVGLNIYS